MTERIKGLLDLLNSKEYRKQRRTGTKEPRDVFPRFLDENEALFRKHIYTDSPVAFENDYFGFNRSIDTYLSPGAGNITVNYADVMAQGFDKVIERIKDSMSKTDDKEKLEYGKCMLEDLYICLEFCDKQKEQAKDSGNTKLYNALCKLPRKSPESFYEACLFMKLCIYCLRWTGATHLGLGRFDQYMYPYYLADKARGVSDEEIFETVEEFFISINFDSDLYFGIQQGDNGQSMVLGGFDKDGKSVYNELSQMCMEASLELNLIDPKINLRVGKNTPDELYEFATLLTKQGLGFPQYCNDDVVVPGLIKLGYDPEDAIDYTVAACWEFIIPNCGGDTPNRRDMDFPSVTNRAIHKYLESSQNFDELMEHVAREIICECDAKMDDCKDDLPVYIPLISVFTDGCIESLTNIWSGGAKYENYGCHGAGIAVAADSLAAIKKLVFDEKKIGKTQLISMLDANYEGFEEERKMLACCPKMGNNDDYVDDIANFLMKTFSGYLNNKPCPTGGVWRAGTGSAHGYIYLSEKCPATANGRKDFEPYPSSFSPSLDVRPDGILSVIQSFTKFDLSNIINGGPLTLEIHDSVLRNDIGIKKTAQLVKSFIDLGGHQLQLNSVNREILLDAKAHPEKYPNLIVRVWGWSGYFNELDSSFQDHIIRRCEFEG